MATIVFIVCAVLFGLFLILWANAQAKLDEARKEIADLTEKNENLTSRNASLAFNKEQLESRIVLLSEPAPVNGKRSVDNVLALSDKLKEYVKKDGNKISIKIVK